MAKDRCPSGEQNQHVGSHGYPWISVDTHDFPLPEGLVENEFQAIWNQIMSEAKAGRVDAEDRGKNEEELKAEYRTIAERRVRLGLILSEVATANKLDVSPEEFNAAIQREMAMNPGQ